MTRKNTKLLIVILLTIAISLTACGPKIVPEREVPKKVYLSANPADLLNDLTERNRKISSIRTSKAELEYRYTFARRDFRGTGLRLALKKPGKVFASAAVAGSDIFSLFSDGKRYWAEVDREKEVYTGSIDAKRVIEKNGERELWEGFNPMVLSEAFLLDDLSEYPKNSFAIQPDFYIIFLFDEGESGNFVLRRLIWIEREGLTVRRHQVYNEAGELMTEAWLHRYADVDGVQLPHFSESSAIGMN